MAPVLLDIARKDTDAKVRFAAVDAMAALGLESSIEPLSQIVLSKDYVTAAIPGMTALSHVDLNLRATGSTA